MKRGTSLPFTRDETFCRLEAEGRASVGRHSYGAPTILWWGEDSALRIGAFCSIADGVEIVLGGNHRTEWATTFPFTEVPGWPTAREHPGHPATKGDVTIGNDVWIARGATILSGVTIGDGAVVGAYAVVARDVAPYEIVAGNPARTVRQRFDPPTVEALLGTRWWELGDDALRRLLPTMLSPDVHAFVAAAHEESDRARTEPAVNIAASDVAASEAAAPSALARLRRRIRGSRR